LLDRVRDKIRFKYYSIRTEQAYVDWSCRFILFHGKRHPQEMGATEVEAFLTHLAVRGKLAASTQNQARSALLFLYKEALDQSRPGLENVDQAKRPQRLPVVLTHAEVKAVLDRLRHTFAHGRLRHPHGAETARPLGGLDHHDLHSPPQPGRQR